jgi:molecular chaperone GrpE
MIKEDMKQQEDKKEYTAPESEAAEIQSEEAIKTDEAGEAQAEQEAEESQAECADDCQKKLRMAEEKVAELEDKNLRMMAEFDNYRRRTNKEKLELIETAGERIFTDMLPLIDDMERAMTALDKSEDVQALKEGMLLIQQKFLTFLEKNNVKQAAKFYAFIKKEMV